MQLRVLNPLALLLGILIGCSAPATTPPDARPGRDRVVDPFDLPGGDVPLTGRWAVKAVIKAKAMVVGNDQDVTSVLLLDVSIDDVDGQVTLASRVCDFQLPQVPGFESRLIVPQRLLENVGEVRSTATRGDGRLTGARQIVTIGVVLERPETDDFPAPPALPGPVELGPCEQAAPGRYCDQEADGQIGGTLVFEPPFSIPGLIKLSKVYAGARTVVALDGRIAPDGRSIVGDIVPEATRLDTQVLGCERCDAVDGPDCDNARACAEAEAQMVAAFNPMARPQEGSTFLAVKLDEPLTCDEIKQRQVSLFR